jgi:hypothetical protein
VIANQKTPECGAVAITARTTKISRKKFVTQGTVSGAGHFPIVTAETPPPVQAAGDTIPEGPPLSRGGGLFLCKLLPVAGYSALP